jgi:hypothetical protein
LDARLFDRVSMFGGAKQKYAKFSITRRMPYSL